MSGLKIIFTNEKFTAMISVEKARKLVGNHTISLDKIAVSIKKSLGFYFAEDIYAQEDFPGFNQSAVDGYAFNSAYVNPNELYEINEEIPAGKTIDKINFNGKKDVVYRIFTGAIVPEGMDTIVMQEFIEKYDKNHIKIPLDKISTGANIRKKGYAHRKGDLLFTKGEKINEATIGVLASQGIETVNVYSKPKILCVVTGSELKPLGSELQPGEIYESNSYTLQAVLNDNGFTDCETVHVSDNEEETNRIFQEAITKYDVILFSGGISVGDYDFVSSVMEKHQVQTIFYKVKQKPGKPLFFGKKENIAVFGLPGNPAAALNSMFFYVLPFLRNSMHAKQCFFPVIETLNRKPFKSKPGRTRFLKAYTDFRTTEILDGQNSDQLLSFAKANCIVEIPEDCSEIKENEPLKTHLIREKI